MKVVIATGGTGGHIIPSIYVAKELGRMNHEVFFIGVFGDMAAKIRQLGFSVDEIPAKGFSLKSFGSSFVAMVKSTKQSIGLLKKYRPDAVLGFGGYGSFAVILAAALLRYRTIIHEQNVVPGKANRVLSKFVNRIAVSFEKSRPFFNSSKTIVTGCPCHSDMTEINRSELLKFFNLDEGRSTILIMGGSQGSQTINKEFLGAVKELKDSQAIQVIHICGKQDYAQLTQEYENFGIPFILFEFLENMEDAYKVADVVVSRAGAVTVAELALFECPAVLIPYPYAGAHQIDNASVLEEIGLAKMIKQEELTSDRLGQSIRGLLDHPKRSDGQKPWREKYCFPEAAQRLAQETLSLSK